MKMKLAMLAVLVFFAMGQPAMAADTMVIVVRHAEKAADDPKDPTLSEPGQARARKLAMVLKDAHVSAVYATQYKRTMLTALPTATQSGVSVQVRDATKENAGTYTADLLKEIQKQHRGKTVLVVGHSNTVTEIVKHLTGVDIVPIGENEFDRLYLITLGKKPKLVSASYNP